MDITAVTSIGGKGTRIKSISNGKPKGLLEINGKTVIYKIAEQIALCGIKNLVLLRGYKSELFDNEIIKIQRQLDLNIISYIEKEALGECGALWEIRDQINSKDLLFVLGDIVFDVDLQRFIDFHKRLDSQFSLITHLSSHPEDSDLIRAPNGTQISDFKFKNQDKNNSFKGFLGNAGISLFNTEILDLIKSDSNIKNKTVFRNLAYEFFKLFKRIYSYNTSEYIVDIGTPERLKKVIEDEKTNQIKERNYKFKQKCLFLDRDNTLIKCSKGKYIIDLNDIQIKKDKIKKIINLRKNFDLCIIITNQPQISMGLLNLETLYDINCQLIIKLLNLGLKIDEISFCPHHPHKGYHGEVSILKEDCFCRKPNPGMIFYQTFLRNIDLENSVLVGDSKSDMLAAMNSGMKFINIEDL